MASSLLVKGARLLDPSTGMDVMGDVLIEGGTIVHAGPPLDNAHPRPGLTVLDGRGMVACPGFIDLHCHLREPGYEYKETIATGTKAAARGGFTTVCAMPNTAPPIDNATLVEFVRNRAAQEGAIRVLPIGCVTQSREGKHLAELGEMSKAGAVGFSDDGNPVANAHLMRQALTYCRALGLPVIDHCEEPVLSAGGVMNEGWVATRLGLKGWPAAAEEAMVARNIALAELTGGHVHLAHVSTAGSVGLLRLAKSKGLPVTAEATPHHLTLSDEWVMGHDDKALPTLVVTEDAYDTRAKVNPPLRGRQDIEALVEALREGIIDAIATDHAPHAVSEKEVTFDEAAFGISNLETAFSSLMTLAHSGQISLTALVHRLTLGPARVLGDKYLNLATLKSGTVADLTVFDPEAEWTVDSSQFASKGKNTPLDGFRLRGRVMSTIYGGELVHCDDRLRS